MQRPMRLSLAKGSSKNAMMMSLRVRCDISMFNLCVRAQICLLLCSSFSLFSFKFGTKIRRRKTRITAADSVFARDAMGERSAARDISSDRSRKEQAELDRLIASAVRQAREYDKERAHRRSAIQLAALVLIALLVMCLFGRQFKLFEDSTKHFSKVFHL